MVTYQYIRFFADMGRKRNAVPSRLFHKPSGQDRILWNGRSIYLGKHGSAEADANYRRLVRNILELGEPEVETSKVTVSFLADRFLVHTRESFPAESREPMAYERAMDLLKESLGGLPAASVTPAKFAAMRDAWAKRGASVRTVNKHHNQTIAAFRWGVTVELVPAEVWYALQAVPRLKPNRSAAKAPRVVEPVPWEHVEAIKPHVRAQVWAMIEIHWLTGMRSGELLAMTPGQIRDGVYRPGKHKNAWRGHVREIPLGPRALELIGPHLEGKGPDDRVFPGYSSQSYGRAVSRACEDAGVPHWHPHQIRHAFATRVREIHGLDAAQAVLGHKTARVTEIYAAKSTGLAKKVVDDLG
ncbi:tyrosine-type recombinase/integrase [bacterium]|nr:tyrosine-type recombinase/integrase [bacterium]